MEHKGEIYIVTNTLNNKKYVGQAVCFIKQKNGYLKKHGTEGRWKSHIWFAFKGQSRCTALCAAIRKYGVNNFTIKTLLICEEHQLSYYENKMMRYYNCLSPNGYNLKEASSKGRVSESTRQKLCKANSKENNAMFGKHHTQHTLDKMTRTKKGKLKKPLPLGQEQELQQLIYNLPKYMYFRRDLVRQTIGFKVRNHPVLKNKEFTSKLLTIQEKFKLANSYLLQESSENK